MLELEVKVEVKVELVLDLPAGFEAYSKSDKQLKNVRQDDRQIVRMDVTKAARRMQPDKAAATEAQSR